MNETLLAALGTVIDPELRRPITDLGMVSHAEITSGVATVGIRLTIQGCPLKDTIQQDVRDAVIRLDGVEDVHIDLDYMNAEQRRSLRDRLGHTKTNPFASPDNLTQVYAVASGKGGVGKSTVTANLAAALASDGLSVGIVDADVHGFSIPGLLGVTQPPTKLEDMILPPVVEVPEHRRRQPEGRPPGSIRVISIGMFVEGNQPIAWRGPMLHRALEQFLTDVHFGDLDVLLLDLPPGTGDVAISMSQLVPTASLLVVSTPQAAAVDVAERAGTMSLQTGQKVLGVVENMSAMVMPDGSRVEMFGEGGGKKLSERLTQALDAEVPLLGSVPLDLSLRRGGDEGTPVVWSDPDSPSGTTLRAIAESLREHRRGLSGKSLPLNLI
ncbi:MULTISPECIES: Mrp/NBP35 family ATP-binding protein [Micrococcales]|uniref:Mrp/NBP35 family ATP-binding protein n=1 Tax=Micrococcales TaxID=85006 RepID=UPI0004AB74AA|nr:MULTISPECIES: Mrp/NBP35 family ATP-binding protein [Micrococcales]